MQPSPALTPAGPDRKLRDTSHPPARRPHVRPAGPYLLDASSYIHRAFHAVKGLTTSQGVPTGAVFGFVQMLLKVMKDARPQYLAVVYDAKGPTFRHQLYPAYKANRPPLDPALKTQLPLVRQLVTALGLPAVEMEGFEADDLMASLARQASHTAWRCLSPGGWPACPDSHSAPCLSSPQLVAPSTAGPVVVCLAHGRASASVWRVNSPRLMHVVSGCDIGLSFWLPQGPGIEGQLATGLGGRVPARRLRVVDPLRHRPGLAREDVVRKYHDGPQRDERASLQIGRAHV